MEITNIEYDYLTKIKSDTEIHYLNPVATVYFELDSGFSGHFTFDADEVDGQKLKDIKHKVQRELMNEIKNDSDYDSSRHIDDNLDEIEAEMLKDQDEINESHERYIEKHGIEMRSS